jgi:Skp family chaperone for outer membrane proteins
MSVCPILLLLALTSSWPGSPSLGQAFLQGLPPSTDGSASNANLQTEFAVLLQKVAGIETRERDKDAKIASLEQTTRQQAETSRQQAEQAETSRQQAEASRQQAETSRQQIQSLQQTVQSMQSSESNGELC